MIFFNIEATKIVKEHKFRCGQLGVDPITRFDRTAVDKRQGTDDGWNELRKKMRHELDLGENDQLNF